MKNILKIFVIAAAAFFAAETSADAQLLQSLINKATSSTTTEQSTATTNGQTAGVALKALYTQFKADGKLDMSNLNNILNLTALSNSIKDLKGMTNKSTFYKEFAQGLIMGSNNLVTSTNSTSIMNGLTSLVNNVDLSGLTQKAESAQDKATSALSALSGKTTTALDNANEIANSVSSILNLFK